jgi:penicillin-binding protein 1A
VARYVVRFARTAVIVALFVVAALLGIASGVLFAYAGDVPEIASLDNYAPNTITRVLAADGQVIGEFAVERRLVVGYDDISPWFREAVVAAEDSGFNSHFGVSVTSIAARAVRDGFEMLEDALTGRRSRPYGGSTITQQLARALFAKDIGFRLGDTSLERKIKEAIVAVEIEKRYTKPEILTFYANQILFGHGTYGVEAASRLYFGKHAKDLDLEEAALLAGIIQNPARQSPFVNMDAALARRSYTLQRMADEGYITQAQADAAKKLPVKLNTAPRQGQGSDIAPFFVEEVRQHLEEKYGAKALYENGLVVTTTLDANLQKAADEAVDAGLRRIDKRRGWRHPTENALAEGKSIDAYHDDRWDLPMNKGDIVPAVVESLDKPAPAGGARLRIGQYYADLTRPGFAWTGRTIASRLFKVGDLIQVAITGIDTATGKASVTLEQTPQVEGALLAIDNRTGQIRAMVGGNDFDRSKFNRAVQAYRQIGSTFKPVIYTAAIDRGYTPVSIIVDEPTQWTLPNGDIYAPQNYELDFLGPITLRFALEHSRNVAAVKMMDTLGPETVLGYAKRFGINENFPPYLSIALGAGDATLLEMTSAYTTFPNGGVRMTPTSILSVRDRDGNLLEQTRPEAHEVIPADTAYVMTSLLEGVVRRGTGAAAASLGWPLAGKTGTVNDNTDAWFIGFDPNITVGVWVGLDEKKPIGVGETGAVAALPIWMDFMKAYIQSQPDPEDPPKFDVPGNIVFVPVDERTGALRPEGMPGSIIETFISGTQPGAGIAAGLLH